MKFKSNKNLSPHIVKLKPFKVPEGLTIIVDTREQLPLFKRMPKHTGTINIIRKKVDYGDYTIEGFEDQFAIERKQISDFYSYIGKERKKTTRKMQEFGEIVKNGGWVALVIEESEATILSGFLMSKVPPEVARGFLNSWRVRYGLHSYFSRERKFIERFVLDSMIKFYNVRNEGKEQQEV